ncbi:MAG: RNA polymerase sigma factor RpoH [Rhodospirillales bacterium]|jgi:RNA polymerase sigma-32 factor|nr:RNA polymerase sigma factor RpoH [Rhodospirillales bacterium]MDP6644703.1 RNA polymerase sigma factor RpoH [Rhodospirillales bacterium]MDP6842075.1 RNA polymerase sigma factor RpoH [Rhodospirillales bacterium]|tara:strand:- start:997 stop:1869 length:873 start_codon:yes stop_codon:yes gene_type:complete
MTVTTLPILSGDSGLSRYLNEIKAFPILSAEEEFMLAKRYLDYGETEAAHKLVTSHLRLVAKIAMQFRGYGLPVADLISEGNLGLMKAVKKFEPDKGFRLSTYAMWWIKASVTEYILRSWSMVKLGTMSAQKKLFFSLRKAKRNLGIIDSSDLNPEQAEQLSQKFGLAAADIANMNQRMTVRDMSLNAPVSTEEDSIEFMDTLMDEGPSPETLAVDGQEAKVRNGMLRAALTGLDARERHIFIERRLKDDPITLEQLGKQYGISRERVRQLENRAYGKVEKAIRGAVAAQ